MKRITVNLDEKTAEIIASRIDDSMRTLNSVARHIAAVSVLLPLVG